VAEDTLLHFSFSTVAVPQLLQSSVAPLFVLILCTFKIPLDRVLHRESRVMTIQIILFVNSSF